MATAHRLALTSLALVALLAAAAMLMKPASGQENQLAMPGDPAAPGREDRILRQLGADKVHLRLQALYCVSYVADATPLLPAIRAIAEDENDEIRVRQAALTVLAQEGADVPEVTLDLRQAVLTPGDDSARWSAFYTLRETEGVGAALHQQRLGRIEDGPAGSLPVLDAALLGGLGGHRTPVG